MELCSREPTAWQPKKCGTPRKESEVLSNGRCLGYSRTLVAEQIFCLGHRRIGLGLSIGSGDSFHRVVAVGGHHRRCRSQSSGNRQKVFGASASLGCPVPL